MREADQRHFGPSIADVLLALPDVTGPEFDDIFDEIERLRQHPVVKQVRDVQW